MNEFSTSELLNELILRMKETDGLYSCNPEKIQEAIVLLECHLNELGV